MKSMIFKSYNSKAAKILKTGGIGVIPTDTIYGVVGSALKKSVVKKIYKLRKRNPKKPMIILIGQISDLKKFAILVDSSGYAQMAKAWPPKTSILFPCPSIKFKYLHRGTNALAFRMPKDKKLQKFLQKTGPLVAPSANTEGESPAKTVRQAQKYFGDKIDFYIDNGKIIKRPSRLIQLKNNKFAILRK